MNRAWILRLFALGGLVAVPFATVGASPMLIAPRVAVDIDRVASEGQGTLPQIVVDQLARVRLGVRDLVFRANSRLASLAYGAGLRMPDVSMLTTEPIPALVSLGSSSGFGWRDDPMRHRARFHSGADVRAKPGTMVVAAGDGVVVFSGYHGGYGNLVAVDHGGGVITRYAHLRRIDAKKDSVVIAGQKIGQVGTTGRTTGPHLHFEVLVNQSPVDPVMAMTVAELGRTSPLAGILASFALAPALQAGATSQLDPPRQAPPKQPDRDKTRPDRPGHVKRVRPVS